MAVSEGSYILMSAMALTPSHAIDVKGGSDKSGTNVQLYHRTTGDSQIWHACKPEDANWQLLCSLTGKCLDISGTIRNGANIIQYNDTNADTQRWIFTDLTEVLETPYTASPYISYGGKTYHAYAIRSAKNSNYCLHANQNEDGRNIFLEPYDPMVVSNWWIFVTAPVLTTEGAYEIVLASDTSMCCEVAGGSGSNGANIQVYSRNDSNAQKWHAQIVNEESGIFRLINVNASTIANVKVLDVQGGSAKNGANIQLYSQNAGDGQQWLPMQSGIVKVDGQTLPRYVVRTKLGNDFVLDCKGGGKTAKTNIQLYSSNGSVSQRFAFVKTEALSNGLTAPGPINHDPFTRIGYGTVTVSDLKFLSDRSIFQARYKVRKYTNKRASYVDDSWKNLEDHSTSRSGWGDAWTDTFVASPEGGVVTVPLSLDISLDSTYRSADIDIEVRAFSPNFSTGYAAHGPATKSTIRVVALPTITLRSSDFGMDENDNFGIYVGLNDSFGNKCQQLRCRLIGSDGEPISSWSSSASMTVWFLAGKHLFRLPNNDETVTIEYSMIANDGVGSQINGTLSKTFTYSSSGITASVSDADAMYCVDVAAQAESGTLTDAVCYLLVNDVSDLTMIQCPQVSSSNGVFTWRTNPPLNQNGKILITGMVENSRKIVLVDTYVEGHVFVWNWKAYGTDSPLNACALVFINPDSPPQQTRTYQTDISFNQPAGRRYPVAFSSSALNVSFNIEAVVVDPDARYVAAGPLPQYSSIEDVKKLILLSGRGIHPAYRNPYGDVYQVGIESVDTSKLDVGYTKATITQRVMEE